MAKPLAIVLVLAFLGAALLYSEPTPADLAVAAKYKDYVFAIGDQAPAQVFTNQKLYIFPDGMRMWVFDDGGYTIVATPEKATLSISYDGGVEQSRSISLSSGRVCRINARKELAWGLEKEAAPDFFLGILGSAGKKLRLSEQRGKVVLLDFWASWCQPCMQALPETQARYRKYKDRGLAVLGIDIEGDQALAGKAAASLGLEFPVLMAEADGKGKFNWTAKQVADYQVRAIPAMVLIDKKGVVQKTGFGITDKDIEELLAK